MASRRSSRSSSRPEVGRGRMSRHRPGEVEDRRGRTSWSCGAIAPPTAAKPRALGRPADRAEEPGLADPGLPATSRNWPRPGLDVVEPAVGQLEQVVATDEERAADGPIRRHVMVRSVGPAPSSGIGHSTDDVHDARAAIVAHRDPRPRRPADAIRGDRRPRRRPAAATIGPATYPLEAIDRIRPNVLQAPIPDDDRVIEPEDERYNATARPSATTIHARPGATSGSSSTASRRRSSPGST